MRKSTFLLTLYTSVTVLSVFIFVAACSKRSNATDNGYATEEYTAEKTFSDVQSIADQGDATASGGHMNFRTTGTTSMGCAMVTKQGDSIVIDFGGNNCTGLDGRMRKGKIIATCNGHYGDSGAVHTITFDNYYQNNNKVTGTKTVTNTGHNAAGQPTYSVVTNGSVTLAGGGTISVNWTRTRTWISGYNTPMDFTDDVYEVYGSGTLTRANGAQVAVTIPAATPLVFAAGCRWIEAGTLSFMIQGSTRSLNYGNIPSCDALAELTLANGSIYPITMH
jgi:hypothetical protein